MRLRIAVVLLVTLAAGALYIGAWALLAPESFFTTFPGLGRSWTAGLPPYNEHLVRDVGAFNLVLAALLLWAARSRDARIMTAVSLASLLFTVPHFIFHLNHLADFEPADRIGQSVSLGLSVVAPITVAALVRGTEAGGADSDDTDLP